MYRRGGIRCRAESKWQPLPFRLNACRPKLRGFAQRVILPSALDRRLQLSQRSRGPQRTKPTLDTQTAPLLKRASKITVVFLNEDDPPERLIAAMFH
jgi:hypothetical protein